MTYVIINWSRMKFDAIIVKVGGSNVSLIGFFEKFLG